MSASHPSIDCDGGTGRQVIADPGDNPSPGCLHSAGVGDIVTMVGGLRSEWWARSDQNTGWLQIGIGGRLTLESATEIDWPALHGQFGAGYGRLRDFRADFIGGLELAVAAYPDARVAIGESGVILRPSRPAVARA